jgi:hypothetical protein
MHILRLQWKPFGIYYILIISMINICWNILLSNNIMWVITRRLLYQVSKHWSANHTRRSDKFCASCLCFMYYITFSHSTNEMKRGGIEITHVLILWWQSVITDGRSFNSPRLLTEIDSLLCFYGNDFDLGFHCSRRMCIKNIRQFL